jgi:ketosteroid isomerase-like protein
MHVTTANDGEANLEIVKRYLQAITDGVPFEELKEFFAPDVVQREFPNRLVPTGATRDLAALAEASARGRKVVTRQRFDVKSAVAVGDRVAVEVGWRGTLAVPFGTIPAGGELTASFAVFFEMHEGRIRSQNNYDCFDPW